METAVQKVFVHDEQILKLSLIFIFGRKLTEIFKVKDKDQNPK